MASNVVKVNLLADSKGFTKGMKEAETSATGFGKTASGIKNVVGGFFALQAVSGVVGFLADATTNAIADQKAQDQLALALKNTTGATEDQIAATEEWIDQTARATGVTDDELRPALAELVRAFGDVDAATEAMGTAMDIATAKGIPLETVTKAIGKAAQGNIGALGRLGLKVRDSSGEYLSFEEAMAEANRTMGGATETAAAGAEGSMGRLKIALDETKEEIGTAFIPMVIKGADAVIKLMEAMEPPSEEFIAGLDAVGQRAATISERTSPAEAGLEELKDSFEALSDLLGLSMVPVMGETYDVLSSLTPPIREVEDATIDLTSATEDSTEAFKDHLDQARAAVDPFFAFAEATRDLEAATLEAKEAAEEHTAGSPEHIAALDKVRDAARDVEDAEIAMAEQGGLTADQLRTHLNSLGVYTREEVDIIIAEFNRVNAFRFDAKTIRVTHEVTGGGYQRQAGGPVTAGTAYTVGEAGPETFIPHTSGTVHPKGRGRGGAAMTANITINAGMGSDPNAISKAVVEALQRYQRANGAVPIRTR